MICLLARFGLLMKTRLFNLLAVAACFGWCGCDASLTGRLWQDEAYVAPLPDPKLELSQTSQGILAQYDASYDRTGKQRRFAYFVEPNLDRIARRQKPVFVDPAKAGPQTAIPILPPPTVGGKRPELFAVFSKDNFTFSIYCQGQEVVGPCPLPVFKDSRRTAAQVALTPLTATADAAVVGIVAGAVVGTVWGLGHNDGAALNPDGTPSNFY